jgi:hypothetical protein
MFYNAEIAPTTAIAEVAFLGDSSKVVPKFDKENWEHVGTVKAERVDFRDEKWSYTSDVPQEIDPFVGGFWTWGDVLVRVIPATILESGLYFFRRKEEVR